MQVAVVGAGGYVGRHLVSALNGEGFETVQLSSRDGTGIEPRSGLFRTPPQIPPGVHAVIYLSQSPFSRGAQQDPAHVLSVNALSAVQFASAASRTGVRKFVYASTGNVYAASFAPLSESSPLRRDNWYSLSKVHAEEALALFRDRMDVTIVRFFGVYGPQQTQRLVPTLIEAIAERREVRLEPRPGGADLDGMRLSLCYIDDAVRVVRALLETVDVPVVNVAGDESLSIRAIVEEIGRQLGVPPRFLIADRFRELDLVADTTLLKKLLRPRLVPFADGLARTLAARAGAELVSPARV